MQGSDLSWQALELRKTLVRLSGGGGEVFLWPQEAISCASVNCLRRTLWNVFAKTNRDANAWKGCVKQAEGRMEYDPDSISNALQTLLLSKNLQGRDSVPSNLLT